MTVPASHTRVLSIVTSLCMVVGLVAFNAGPDPAAGASPRGTTRALAGPTVPGAPTIGTATAGNAKATVRWTAPAANGGSAITGYVVTPYVGATPKPATTFTSTSTTQTVTGLTNGTTYTFKVAAINAIGTGPMSSASNAVTPAPPTVPGAPTIGTATAGNAQATVRWTAPAANGGSAITGYVVTPYVGATPKPATTFTSTSTTQTVTGLTNGTTYTFKVAAINAIGTGPMSSASNAVVPVAAVPGAPTIGSASAGNAQATVPWTAPAANGGAAITGYVLTPYVGFFPLPSTTFASTATTQTVTGLTNGTTYRFKVAAINSTGTGAGSATSNAIVPDATCGPPVLSAIACENAQPGEPSTAWAMTGSGDATIQGFATAISTNKGDTVSFKIKTVAPSYHIDILRIGYYQGNGARKIASGILPSAPLPQVQPACLLDTSTELVDCGSWGVSASWTVPTSAVSGVYIARLVRDDTGGASQIMFVVRDDASHSDLLYQTSDTTWEAYNTYGGFSLYSGLPRPAYKVSYNRPLLTIGANSFYYSEYPMVRFLEANGYDVTYSTGVDTDARGPALLNHKVFMSVGHDEYWSGPQRTNVEAARDAGVHLAFFSGNEMFWKTRWEPSTDGSNTARRTLVSYKETHANAVIDPQDPPTWTGTWRDPRFSPPADGGRPENALTGQYFMAVSGTADLQVPAEYRLLRMWRGTAVANLLPGQTLTLAPGTGTLGYEWDEDVDNGFRPAGLIDLSATTTIAEVLADYGNTTTTGVPSTHHLTLYRAPSGALVFGAGTVQWSWGLDTANPLQNAADVTMEQATVNLFADMGAQPATLRAGLTPATPSSDTTPPTSSIDTPISGTSYPSGTSVTISGTATDAGGGVVAAVEVSTDGGTTWHPATGTGAWTYAWWASGTPTTTLLSRAVDDSGNIEVPAGTAAVTIDVPCPCSLWPATAPPGAESTDGASVEVGVQLHSDVAGSIEGIRFYKGVGSTGTHIGNLWTSTGQLLATATFTSETASGWQEVAFDTPVPISAGTTYVASYFAPSGHYWSSPGYFYLPPSMPAGGSTVDSPPLHAPRSTGSTSNGLFAYAGSSAFPVSSSNAQNYFVDVVFVGA